MTFSHPASECPTLAELAAFAAGRDDSLRTHVEYCRRCRALTRAPQAVTVSAQDPAALPRPFSAVPPVRATGADYTAGSVVIVTGPDTSETLLVCVVIGTRPGSAPRVLDVAPISTDVTMSSAFDVILPLDDPLGYPALVEVWNHGVILDSQVRERLGRLSEEASSAVDALYRTLLGEDVRPAVDVARGVAIESDADPRAAFQEAELERTGRFWAPAAILYGDPAEAADTIGDLLGGWLERTGWNVPAYAAHIGWPAEELSLLRDDAFEPLAFPPERIGMALASAVPTSIDFEDALRRSIAVEQFIPPAETSPPQGMVFARPAGRRRPAKRRAPKPTESPLDQAASELEKYVARAVRAFERASGP